MFFLLLFEETNRFIVKVGDFSGVKIFCFFPTVAPSALKILRAICLHGNHVFSLHDRRKVFSFSARIVYE